MLDWSGYLSEEPCMVWQLVSALLWPTRLVHHVKVCLCTSGNVSRRGLTNRLPFAGSGCLCLLSPPIGKVFLSSHLVWFFRDTLGDIYLSFFDAGLSPVQSG